MTGTIAALAAGVLLATGYAVRARLSAFEPPRFQRLTFRRGNIRSARFAPEGHGVIYAAAWEGKPVEIFSTRSDSSESRPLGFPSASLLAVSRRARWR